VQELRYLEAAAKESLAAHADHHGNRRRLAPTRRSAGVICLRRECVSLHLPGSPAADRWPEPERFDPAASSTVAEPYEFLPSAAAFDDASGWRCLYE